MMFLFLQFLIAHLLGDFVLQPKSWVTDKEKNKIKAKSLYAHIAVHVICLLVLLGCNTKYILGFSIVITSHFLIDLVRIYIQRKKTKQVLFFISQFLHLFFISFAVCIYYPINLKLFNLISEKDLLFISSIIFLTFPSSEFINYFFYSVDKKITNFSKSIKNIGKYIGITERILVFTFIITNNWEAVGFLLAAKSFRFNNLEKNDTTTTEYRFLGTLLSFGLAILAGIVYNKILS